MVIQRKQLAWILLQVLFPATGALVSQWGRRSQLSSRTSLENIAESPSSTSTSSMDTSVNRRQLFFAPFLVGTALVSSAQSANAGGEAKIEFPNVLQGLEDRATKQCLVETLGNRECLVYADPTNRLYEGYESSVLVERIQRAAEALEKIPTVVEAKKWSQVNGILTGPLGDLVRTMNQLVELSPDATASKKLVQKCKTDLYAIAAASERKDGALALKYHKLATDDLVAFLKSL